MTLIHHRYRIIKTIGEGGMGTVYQVRDVLRGNRTLALKTIKKERINPATLNVFKQEFDIATRLKHPNLARVYDFGWDRTTDLYYLTMEYVGGESLADSIRAQLPISTEEALSLIVTLCRALEFIHSRGILHRDIKPGNIMFQTPERDISTLKILDFGLADLGLQQPARTKGTLLYMAPEVLHQTIDPRTDIFALGMTLLERLNGQTLYRNQSSKAILHILKDVQQFEIRQQEALQRIDSPDLRHVIRRLIAYNPNERFQTASDVILAINQHREVPFPLETVQTREAYVQSTSFIAREAELKTLVAKLNQPQNADQLLLLTGESGVGKTRLLQELKKYCQLHAINGMEGYISRDGSKTFAPIIDILNEAILNASPELCALYAGDLKKLLPNHPKLQGMAAKPVQDSQIERSILIEAITRFLIDYSIEAQETHVLLFHRLGAADPGTQEVLRELLFKLSRLEPAERFFRIFACSQEEELPHIQPLIDNLNAKQRLQIIRLSPFRRTDIEQYMIAIFGQDRVGKSLFAAVEAIERQVGGNPLYLQELVKSLVERGIIIRQGKTWELTAAFAEAELSHDVKMLVKHRLERLNLSFTEMQGLQILALVNKSIPLEIFEQLLILKNPPEAIDILRALEDKELITGEEVDQTILYRPSHDCIREVVQDQIPNPAQIHHHIAEQLELIYQLNLDNHVEELAYHYCQTNNQAKIRYYLEKSASKAVRNFANQKAIQYYELLLEKVELDEAEQIAILHQKGDILQRTGQWSESLALYQQTLERAQQLNDERLVVASQTRVATIFYNQGNYPAALELLQACLAYYERTGSPAEVGKIHNKIGNVYFRQQLYPQAMAEYQQGLAIAKKIQDKHLISETLGNVANVHLDQAQFEEGFAYYTRKLKIDEEIGNERGIAVAIGTIGNVHFWHHKDYEKALEYYQRQAEIATKIGDKASLCMALGNSGNVFIMQHQFEEALRYYHQQLEFTLEMGDKRSISVVSGNMGVAYLSLGKYEEALRCYRRKWQISEELGNKLSCIIALNGMSDIYKQWKNYAEAEKYLDMALEYGDAINDTKPRRYYLCGTYYSKADLKLKMQKYDEVEPFLTQAYTWATETNHEEMITKIRILQLQLKYYQSETPHAVLDEFEALLAELDPPDQAKLDNELYEMTHRNHYRNRALKRYKKLAAKYPGGGYQRYIEKLAPKVPQIAPYQPLNRYRRLHALGEGEMGTVVLVEDLLRGRQQMVLKAIKPDTFTHKTVEAFKKEFEVMTRLRHPNLVRVYDFGADRTTENYFIIMEYVDGVTLSDLLREQRQIGQQRALDIMVDLCRAVQFIHSRGILHRDLKPGNIMLTGEQVKVLDFGLADLADHLEQRHKGTLLYMAPEVLNAQTIDHGVDIYALGVTFYQLLTGHVLFSRHGSGSLVNILKKPDTFKHQQQLELARIESPPLREIVSRMIAYHPTDRYAGGVEVIEDINRKLNTNYPLETPETRRAYVMGADFIGRDAELHTIKTALMESSQPQLVLLTGEAGIGKSRLIQELKKHCRIHHIRFVEAKCIEHILTSYSPFIDIISELLYDCSANVIQIHGSTLKKILPRHPQLQKIMPDTVQIPSTEQRILIQTITDFLMDILAEQDEPLVLCLEDIHAADSGSWQILTSLLDHQKKTDKTTSHLSLIATARTEQLERIQNWLKPLQDRHHLHRIELQPLTPDAIQTYLTGIFGKGHVGNSLQSALSHLQQHIGGNPLLLQEIVKSLVETEVIDRRGTSWELTKPLPEQSGSLDSVEIIEQRWKREHFSPDEVFCLQILALLEDEVRFEILQEVIIDAIQTPLPQILDRLEQAEWITSLEVEGMLFYRLAHSKVQEMIVASITDKPYLHQYLAQHLEHIFESSLEEHVDHLAHHYYHAQNTTQARIYLEKAAEKAKANFANDKAIRYYDQLLELIPPEEVDARIDIQLKKGRVQLDTTALDDALATYTSILNHNSGHGDPLHRAKGQLGLAITYYKKSNYSEALKYLRPAYETFLSQNNLEGQAECLQVSGLIHWHYGEAAAALANYQNGLEIANTIDNQYLKIKFLNNIGLALKDMGKPDDAMNAFQKQYQLALEQDDLTAMAISIGNMGIVHRSLGQYEQAMACYRQKLEVSQRIGNKIELAAVHGNIGNVHYLRGEYDQALQHYQRNLVLAEEVDNKRAMSIALINIAALYTQLKEFDKAEAAYQKALTLCRTWNLKKIIPSLLQTYANFCYHLDRLEEAKTMNTEAHQLAEKQHQPDLVFQCRFLDLKIRYRQSTSPAEQEVVIDALKTLRTQTNQKEHLARINDELYQIIRNQNDAKQAIQLYESLYQQTPNIDYQHRIDALTEAITTSSLSEPPAPQSVESQLDELEAEIVRLKKGLHQLQQHLSVA